MKTSKSKTNVIHILSLNMQVYALALEFSVGYAYRISDVLLF